MLTKLWGDRDWYHHTNIHFKILTGLHHQGLQGSLEKSEFEVWDDDGEHIMIQCFLKIENETY